MEESGRDHYIDFLRSFSLVIVVIWHWVFTILIVSADTVSPTNPIGFTRGMWVITWVLQVMPVFFFVGGYTHRLAFDNYVRGTSRRFLKRRIRRLLMPALGLTAIWVVIGFILEATIDPDWTWSAVILVLSPLWFIVVYVVLVLIAPLAIRAHWRWGELVPVWLLGLAAVLDVLRFTHGQGWAAWVNFLVIWGLAHQLGFFYDRFVAAAARTGWMLFWARALRVDCLDQHGVLSAVSGGGSRRPILEYGPTHARDCGLDLRPDRPRCHRAGSSARETRVRRTLASCVRLGEPQLTPAVPVSLLRNGSGRSAWLGCPQLSTTLRTEPRVVDHPAPVACASRLSDMADARCVPESDAQGPGRGGLRQRIGLIAER